MKRFTPPSTQVCCDIAVVLAICIIGCTTATIFQSLTASKERFRIDVVDEINTMAGLLNGLIPLAVLALAASAGIRIRKKNFQPITLLTAIAGLLGVSACAIAMYGCLVALHPGVNLWSRIWWRFAS